MTLKQMRMTIGLTQILVAKHFNVTQVAISQWENGDSYPHPSKIPKLANLYCVTEGDIIVAITSAKQENKTSA